MKKIKSIFIILSFFFTGIFYAEDYKAKIQSVKYIKNRYIYKDTELIDIPLVINFNIENANVFYLGKIPKDKKMRQDFINTKLNVFNTHNKLKYLNNKIIKFEKNDDFKATVNIGYELVILDGNKTIFKTKKKVLVNNRMQIKNDNYELIFPQNYCLSVKMPAISLNNQKNIKDIKKFNIKIIDPYIEILTPAISILEKKLVSQINLVACDSIVLEINLIKSKQKKTSKLIEKTINTKSLPIELKGYYWKDYRTHNFINEKKILNIGIDLYFEYRSYLFIYERIAEIEKYIKQKRTINNKFFSRETLLLDLQLDGIIKYGGNKIINFKSIIYNTGVGELFGSYDNSKKKTTWFDFVAADHYPGIDIKIFDSSQPFKYRFWGSTSIWDVRCNNLESIHKLIFLFPKNMNKKKTSISINTIKFNIVDFKDNSFKSKNIIIKYDKNYGVNKCFGQID